MLLLSALFSAIAMWATAWWLTRQETRISLRSMIWISIGIYLASYALVHWLNVVGVGLSIVALVLALMHFCGLSTIRATLVAMVWLTVQILFAYGIAPLY